jgi:Eukaryotic aspartyl protease
VIFGGIDSSKYTNELVTLPIVPSPDNLPRLTVAWFSLNIYVSGNLVYQSSQQSISLSTGPATLLDSGTTLAFIPQDVFDEMQSLFSLTQDENTGLWLGACSIASSDTTLEFGFGVGPDVTITVPASEILRPGSGADCLFGFQPLGSTTSPYILGDTFLTSAYVYFDFDAYTISLAQANWT